MKRIALCAVVAGLFVSSAQAGRLDWSDAADYEAAKHNTGEWQRLGELWDKENGMLPVDASDDGISWSINGSDFGHDDMAIGDEVTFRFDFRRKATGSHASDSLGAWIDWDQGNDFANIDERLEYHVWARPSGEPATILQKYVDVTITIAETIIPGDYWLRGRVCCNTSLPGNNPDALTPYGRVRQGEVEDWKFTVTPEPGTIAIAAIGGLMIIRRRR